MLPTLLALVPLTLPGAFPSPALAPAPVVQEVHRDARLGFQFRPPRGWRSIPLKTDEAWLAAKYLSDKTYFYTDKVQGYTFEHTPEMLCISFIEENLERKKIEEVEIEDGVEVKTTTISNPYKDYEDFLERTYQGGGWFVDAKEEGEHKGIKVTRYDIKVEKLARTGPKRIVTWVFHTAGIDFAMQVEVLETEYAKLKKPIDAMLKSFEAIERSGESLGRSAFTPDSIRITRRERNAKDPAERRSVRQKSQKADQERAIAALPSDWKHESHGNVLVLNHQQDDWSKRLGEHAQALIAWLESDLAYFGEGEYARGPIIRVCKDEDETMAFTRGVRSGTSSGYAYVGPGEEIVTFKDTAGWIGWQVGFVNLRLMLNWMLERDEDLANALPTWLRGGLDDYVEGARLDGRKLDFRVDNFNRDNARLAVSQDRATPPREIMRFSREEFESSGGEASGQTYWNRRAEAGMLVRFLMSKEASRCKQAKGLLESYVRSLSQVVAEVEKKGLEEQDKEPPKTEEEEEERAKERANRWKEREREILDQTFERTFGAWKEADWEKFHKAYFDYISS